MRQIELEFRVADYPTIDLIEFSNLLHLFDKINNIGFHIQENDILDKKHYDSDRYYPETRPSIRTISKKSPLSVVIVFGSISALWVITQIADKLRKWNIDKKILELQHEKLEYETNEAYLKLQEKKIEVESKLLKKENQLVLKKLIEEIDSNKLDIDSLKIVDEISAINFVEVMRN